MIDKSGKVLAAEAGSPDGTVAVVRKLVEAGVIPGSEVTNAPEVAETKNVTEPGANGSASKDDVERADIAADVADTAEKLDSNEMVSTAAA